MGGCFNDYGLALPRVAVLTPWDRATFMVMGFKRRFEQFVREGSKTHSIREDPNDRWRIGCYVDAFVDARQKTMTRLLPPMVVVRTERVEIISQTGWHDGVAVIVDGIELSPDEKDALAFRDGFRDTAYDHHFYEMVEFWNGRMPFKGKIIHWKHPHPVNVARSQAVSTATRGKAKEKGPTQ